MAVPWLVAIAAEYLVFRRVLRRATWRRSQRGRTRRRTAELPMFVLVVLGLTLAGFAVTSFLGWHPPGRRWPVRSCSGCAA